MSRNRVVHVKVDETPESDDPFYRDLRLFIGSGSLEHVTLLLDSGADVNSRDAEGRTLLMWASVVGRIPIMRLLIERGADINAVCNHGQTALMRAAGYGHTEAARLLMEHEA